MPHYQLLTPIRYLRFFFAISSDKLSHNGIKSESGHMDHGMSSMNHGHKHSTWYNHLKLAILLVVWAVFTGIMMSKSEKIHQYRQMAVPVDNFKSNFIDSRCYVYLYNR